MPQTRGIVLLAAVIALAAWVASAPPVYLPVAPIRAIPIAQIQAPAQTPTQAAPGTTPDSPLYVRARCDQGCGGGDDGKSIVQKLVTDPVALFTALLFVCTALLWRSTFKLSETTLSTLKHAEKTSQQQLRAYVNISKRQLKLQADGQWWCTITIKNCGQTPAMNMKYKWELWTDTFPKPQQDMSLAAEEKSGPPLFPGDEPTAQHRLKISPALEAEIRAGQKAVWAKGAVSYDDIFGNTRHVHFKCYTSKFLGDADCRMSVAEDGNEAE